MRKYHDNHDCNRNRMHGEYKVAFLTGKTTHDWVKIMLLMLFLPVWMNHHHRMVIAAEQSTSIMGDSWALNCQPNSNQQQAAFEFCQQHHSSGSDVSTICMCHDDSALWPLCKQQKQQSRRSSTSLSSYGMCDLETYTGCLISCSAFIETVLCQDTELLQCTVVASNLPSYVS
ncbi:hypothetical protein BCR42DRAFT_424574 [Absidia repens]|uniref:Uncharacterized protein n=1 Tax=Absidia repens TaxID=90262 RepID=A0A1X2I3L2_9FUNG|nr:hypothetical protein BCR42DRAFT_424574 [Absidia repens]